MEIIHKSLINIFLDFLKQPRYGQNWEKERKMNQISMGSHDTQLNQKTPYFLDATPLDDLVFFLLFSIELKKTFGDARGGRD